MSEGDTAAEDTTAKEWHGFYERNSSTVKTQGVFENIKKIFSNIMKCQGDEKTQ